MVSSFAVSNRVSERVCHAEDVTSNSCTAAPPEPATCCNAKNASAVAAKSTNSAALTTLRTSCPLQRTIDFAIPSLFDIRINCMPCRPCFAPPAPTWRGCAFVCQVPLSNRRDQRCPRGAGACMTCIWEDTSRNNLMACWTWNAKTPYRMVRACLCRMNRFSDGFILVRACYGLGRSWISKATAGCRCALPDYATTSSRGLGFDNPEPP